MFPRGLLVITLVIGFSWSLNVLNAKPKLGGVKSKTATHVTLDAQGVPVIGGEEGLMVEDWNPQSCLLKVRVGDSSKTTYRYLVYPLGKDSKPEILVKDTLVPNDPDVGCYWKQDERIPESVRDDLNPVNIKSFYFPTRGPHNEHWLSSDKDKKLILRDKNNKTEIGGFVGVIRGYDNLNDGK